MSFASFIRLSNLDGTNGFRLDGIDAGDQSGRSVASAGDVNGDGFDDLVIGAYDAGPDGKSGAGESYVVFGTDAGFSASLSLAALDGSNGFRLDGINALDRSGISVASAGDVNGDGFDDLVIGAYEADPDGKGRAGETYVVFGTDAGFSASLSLAALDGSNGFRLDGIDAGDRSGFSVASAGDVNGDGFDDLVIGAYRASPDGRMEAGETYAVFGAATGFVQSITTGTLESDLLSGTENADVIDALAGNDWILPGAGADLVDGGDGTDMVSYVDQVGRIDVRQNGSDITVLHRDFIDDLINVEGVTGTSSIDVFNAFEGRFRGMAGEDSFFASGAGEGDYDGGDGRDYISYSASTSGISASLLRDRGWGGDAAGDRYANIEQLFGTNHDDFIWGDHGNNFLRGLQGDDTLVGNGGDDYILAGFGTDVIIYSGNRSEYSITQDGIRTDVSHLDGGVDGNDIIGHAEILRFADGDFML